LDVLARLADTNIAALRELNPQYVRMVTPPRQEAVVRVPAGSGELVTERYAALEPKARVSYVEHVVSRGQTVASIAHAYRVPTRVIQDANPGVRLSRLRPGTRLVIPTSFVPTMPEPPAPSRRATIARTEAATSSSTTIRYRVRSGESLWTIAGAYHTTVEQLRSINALTRNEKLKAGQVIRVPAPVKAAEPESTTSTATAAPAASARSHVVRRGETLSTIAGRYGVSVPALREANGLGGGSAIKAGSRLVIPD
ncbi:MAG TPA: LysM peptidoglycan-binding domain-containing protein, partial [Gemmatimonadales bacterium]|nr:LysM peptidoglycan-binding domain-containing protein [Gemmatimonadales bacterium]